MSDNFHPHSIEWTPTRVQRFWDFLASDPGLQQTYFSRLTGKSLLHTVTRYVPLAGTVVDLGAGPGYLVGLLLQSGAQVIAVDSSPASVESLSRRFAAADDRVLAVEGDVSAVPLDDNSADAVFLVETVEHLPDEVLEKAITEIRRVLRPAGHVIITTPNEEDLARSHTMCPECGAQFHTVQHVRSVSAGWLADLMAAGGFQTVVSTPTLFVTDSVWQSTYDRLVYSNRLRAVASRFIKVKPSAKLPHLLYIGRKGPDLQ